MYHGTVLHNPDRVTKLPLVAVTATTKLVNDLPKVMVNRAYTDAIIAAGLIPLLVPPMTEDGVPDILDAVQGLVLTGGEDLDPSHFGEPRHPATGEANDLRDRVELALAREAAARKLPTLAICRGVQVLNVALGGTLVQDIPSQAPSSLTHEAKTARNQRVHDVNVEGGTRLASIVGEGRIMTNSFHHQAVARLADGLRTVAKSPDGVVEGVECTDRGWWAIGVQWHPEELVRSAEDWDRKLFGAFGDAVRSFSRHR